MEDEKFRICLFNGTNFGSWKFRLEAILEQHDLKKHILNELDDLTSGKEPKVVEMLTREEKRCKAIIINHIADEQLEYIKDQTSSKGIFDTLKSVFERKTISSQLFIRKKLLSMKYNEVDDMNQFLLSFDKVIRELKESGAQVEDCDAVCHLLLSLPKSFEAVVAALETIDQSNLTLDFVKARLLDEYNKRKNSVNQRSYNQTLAFGTQKQKFNFKCHNCGKVGHKRSECRSKLQTESSNRYRTASNFRYPSSFRQSANTGEASEIEEEEIAFVAGNEETGTAHGKINWLLDSGATEHMVNDEQYFFNVKPLSKPNNKCGVLYIYL